MKAQPRRAASVGADVDLLATLTPKATGGRLVKAAPSDPVLDMRQATEVEATVTMPERADQAAPGQHPASSRDTPAEPSDSKTKVGFYALPGNAARARAAYANLPASVRPTSFSAFLERAMMAAVLQAERDHNEGNPYDGGSAGSIPTGRPITGEY